MDLVAKLRAKTLEIDDLVAKLRAKTLKVNARPEETEPDQVHHKLQHAIVQVELVGKQSPEGQPCTARTSGTCS